MQYVSENKQEKAGAQERNAKLVDATAALGRGGCCGSLKLGSTQSSEVGGSPRMAARKVSGPEAEVSVVVDAFDINLVNGTAAIATRSWSSPRNDLGLTAVNRQTKSRFDLINLTPSKSGRDEGVHNGDSLVEDQNFGLNKEKPNEACCGGNYTSLSHPAAVSIEHNLNDEQNINGQSQNRENEGGSRSKHIQIGHQTILPLLQTSSSVEGK